MGCSSSTLSQTVADESVMLRRKPPRGSMLMSGYRTELISDLQNGNEAQRLVASNGSVSLSLPSAGYALRYAYISQRGYYPDAPDKANQDAACAAECVGGNAEMHLFGVFDGHGELGTECAQFTQDRLLANLQADPAQLDTRPAAALASALVTANAQLRNASIDDTLSGTTACCTLVSGRSLHVANVGDSRAVLAERVPGGGTATAFAARELSQDQTPFRPDECMRVMAAGARVLTLDQLEGLKDPSQPCWTSEADCDGDPPRLWAPAGMYPGTAFTRSIGDSAAESIGVISDPEMAVVQLGPQHRFLLLASDGVWEFITSQQAVDLVSRFDNPYDGAKALVAQAYKLWLQHETRTDDITALVIFFDWPAPPEPSAPVRFLQRLRSSQGHQQQQLARTLSKQASNAASVSVSESVS